MSIAQIFIVAAIAGVFFGGGFTVAKKVASFMKNVRVEEELQPKYYALKVEHAALLTQWNALVEEINRKGGRSFLNGRASNAEADPLKLAKGDIKTLLSLCHPDKHGGSKVA